MTGKASLINVVLCFVNVLERKSFRVVAFADGTAAFGEDDEFVTGEIVLFDRFRNNFFGYTVAVNVGRIPLGYLLGAGLYHEQNYRCVAYGVQTSVIGSFEQGECLGSRYQLDARS